MSTVDLYYRILFVFILLVVFYRIQVYLEPYKLPINNKIERSELVAGTFTMFAGTLFANEADSVDLINVIVFFTVLIVNLKFLVFWIYAVLTTFRDKYR